MDSQDGPRPFPAPVAGDPLLAGGGSRRNLVQGSAVAQRDGTESLRFCLNRHSDESISFQRSRLVASVGLL